MSLYYADDYVVLHLGDCREERDWLGADVLVTDPPYGMGWDGNRKHAEDRDLIVGDHSAELRDDALALWHQHQGFGAPALVFGTWRVPRPTDTRQLLLWYKRALGPGMGDTALPWGNATEEIYVIGDGWVNGDSRKRRDNLYITDDARGGPGGIAALTGHPTPKPVGLMEQLVKHCPPGTIADPFAGSGATLLAARNLGKQAIGVELQERYCEIIVKRLQADVLPLEV